MPFQEENEAWLEMNVIPVLSRTLYDKMAEQYMFYLNKTNRH